MTIIALHSDLHLDIQPAHEKWLRRTPDILILAGDITRIDKAEKLLVELTETHPLLEVIYVTGNHEYYDIADMMKAEAELAAALINHPRIHFLQCESVELSGIRFIGCTGWSQMLALGKAEQQKVQEKVGKVINDFYLIGIDGRRFTPNDCIQLGKQHYQWLESQLSLPRDKKTKTVVITHFSPSLKTSHPLFSIDEISAYFCASFDALIEKYQPEIWAFGHTHANFDIPMGKTRVVSNQQGYGHECKDSYEPNMVIWL